MKLRQVLPLLLAGALLAPPAWAEAPAIDMTVPLLDEAGRPMPDANERAESDPTCAKCPPFTVSRAVVRALLMSEEKDPADKKWADAALAMRIRDNPSQVRLNAEEVAVIKKKLGRFGGLVLYQVYPLIDPNAQAPPVKP